MTDGLDLNKLREAAKLLQENSIPNELIDFGNPSTDKTTGIKLGQYPINIIMSRNFGKSAYFMSDRALEELNKIAIDPSPKQGHTSHILDSLRYTAEIYRIKNIETPIPPKERHPYQYAFIVLLAVITAAIVLLA